MEGFFTYCSRPECTTVVGDDDHYRCGRCQQLFCFDCVVSNIHVPAVSFECECCSCRLDDIDQDDCNSSALRLLHARLKNVIRCIDSEEIEDGSTSTSQLIKDKRLMIAGQNMLKDIHNDDENVASCLYLATELDATADIYLLDVLPNTIPLLRKIKEVLDRYSNRY